jgi:hypothetical protein
MRGLLQIQMESIMLHLQKYPKLRDFLKKGSHVCALIFKPSRLLAKGKVMSLAKAFCLSKGSMTFNGI